MSDNNAPQASAAVVLTLRGERFLTPRLPASFTAACSRSAESAARHGEFLPPGFLIPRQTIALGERTQQQRGSKRGPAPEVALHVAPDEVVVLELAEGGLLVTSGERLQAARLTEMLQATTGAGASRGILGALAAEQISRIYTMAFGAQQTDDPLAADLGDQVEGWLIDQVGTPLAGKAVAGVVWAIEQRLTGLCGLRRWHRGVGLCNWPLKADELPRQLPHAAEHRPLLVFVHDLASDTLGSFGALQGSQTLTALERQFPGGVYGFEHRTLSCSPVANAIALVQALPQGAHVSLVTLGRGGLVGDLLCVTDFSSSNNSSSHLPTAQRAELDQLAATLQDRQLVVQRYLRVASPANGTALLGESLDLFLSGVLSVVGFAAKADPLADTVYAAFQRVVLEMVRRRADASAIPGLADLVPDAPLARFLREAPVREGLQMAVIAGDTDGHGGWLRRIGLWLMDKVLIGSPHHDLVVDTPSMLAGVAGKARARARLDARPDVSHFRYFQHPPHVRALRNWLCGETIERLPDFEALDAVRAKLSPPPHPPAATGAAVQRSAGPPRSTLRRRLEVSVHATDLRFLPGVLMIGHYEQDPIAGPQAVVDRQMLDQALSQRHSLGHYPGPVGTALAVLPGLAEQKAGEPARGAVIVGLGRFDLPLTRGALTEAVSAGVLRYLMQVSDARGAASETLTLNTLLIGTNSASSLSLGASVEALVRGVLEANARFQDTTGRDLRVARLRMVEMYLDTAITATHVLNDEHRQAVLSTLAAALDTELVCHAALIQHESARPRLFDGAAAGGNYWPRLMVTDAARDPAERVPQAAHGVAAPVATTLRFLHLGQRARVETQLQQRQAGLVEQLMRQQIQNGRWDADTGRALFHLMVPHALKDTVRHFARLVVVVDAYTANLPWELMLVGDPARPEDAKALALHAPLVRQLVASEYRPHVRQSMTRAALVIGNPSLARFGEHFHGADGTPLEDPPDLPGAADEAGRVAEVLQRQGYAVTLLAGEPQPLAPDVVKALYRQPWRILHVCGHGVFAQRNVDGVALTGVLLSDGGVISAAEIAAMEMVPELVFLNCCHLGQMTESMQQGSVHRLAASLARELIAVGVRCVVVAGWAVGDVPALAFGETFYARLLGEKGLTFGDAVFEARKEAWEVAPHDITWGAYQAYGDPGWRAQPLSSTTAGGPPGSFVSPDELLEALAQLRIEWAQRVHHHQRHPEEDKARENAVKLLLVRGQPSWKSLPAVQSALARGSRPDG